MSADERKRQHDEPVRGEPGGDAYTTPQEVEPEDRRRPARDDAATTRPSDVEPGPEDADRVDDAAITEPRHVEER